MKRPYQDDHPGEPFFLDDEDVVCRTRRRKGMRAPVLYRVLAVLSGAVAVGAFVLIQAFDVERLLAPPPQAPDPEMVAVQQTAPVEILRQPQPLADCIKAGNLIDEAVVLCRDGERTRYEAAGAPQGMVSARYLAQYKADQASRPSSRQPGSQELGRATVLQLDGQASYSAEWVVSSNRITSGSVCANYRQGSIDFRECRKGAKVYFKQKCRDWKQRWEIQREDSAKALQERYCSAGENFSPMG